MTRKALIVATSEFTTLTRSKAFVIGVALMPVLMSVAFGAQKFAKDTTAQVDRRFVVVDRTGVLYDTIQGLAAAANRQAHGSGPVSGQLLPQQETFAADDAQARVRLSDRVRSGQLYAFVEIPDAVLDPAGHTAVSYYSSHASDETLPHWLGQSINAAIIARRFRQAQVDPVVVTRLMRTVEVDQLGLLDRDARGGVTRASRIDPVRTIAVPAAAMMILLFSVMSTAPQLLNSTIEEKMSRVSEVLIGSVTPFELMSGKLLGTAAVSLLLAVVYVAGGIAVARHYGYGDAILPSYVAWLFAFLALAILMFGSVFIAIGAACTDLKDTQALMPPAMLMMMLPFMVWFPVVRAPESPLALGLSLWPTAAPFLMLLRVAIPPGPPLWQIALSFALTTAAAAAAVYAAGKIFRTGLLMQGKSATFGEMLRWVRA